MILLTDNLNERRNLVRMEFQLNVATIRKLLYRFIGLAENAKRQTLFAINLSLCHALSINQDQAVHYKMKFLISNFTRSTLLRVTLSYIEWVKFISSNYWKLVVFEIGNSPRSGVKGYTLIELLAVISILVILTGIISGIIYSTLRGGSKTRITTEVTQNGTYAIGVISNILAPSRGVTKVGGVEINDCTTVQTGSSITVKSIDGGETTFACSGTNISSNSVSLINTNQVQIQPGSCSFSCQQKSTDAYSIPVVSVKFTIEDKNAALFENKSSSLFKTSVSLRNYSP